MDLKESLLGEDAAKTVNEAANKDLENVVPEIVGLLGENDTRIRASRALMLIAQKAPGSKAMKDSIPDLLKLLKEKETSLYGALAIGVLLQEDPDNMEISKGIPAHAPLFLALMYDVDEFIQQNGYLLLRHVALKDPDTVLNLKLLSFLLEMLGFDRWRSRWYAISIIGKILLKYPQNKDILGAVPRFLELLKDESWEVRLNAAGITGLIAGRSEGLDEATAKDITAGLAMALKDENDDVRVMASGWLFDIVSENPEYAKDLVPAFEGALKDTSSKVRGNAEKALKAIKG